MPLCCHLLLFGLSQVRGYRGRSVNPTVFLKLLSFCLSLCVVKWHYARSYCGSQPKNMWGLGQQPGGGAEEDPTCHPKIQLHCYGEWSSQQHMEKKMSDTSLFDRFPLCIINCLLAGHRVSRCSRQTDRRVQKQRWLSVPATALQCGFAQDNPAGPHIHERTRGISSWNINMAVQF